VVVLCHDPHQIDGVVARLIDPALPEPHRFMPAQPREGMTGSRTPTAPPAPIFGIHEDGTR
jgi:hypothetical protein